MSKHKRYANKIKRSQHQYSYAISTTLTSVGGAAANGAGELVCAMILATGPTQSNNVMHVATLAGNRMIIVLRLCDRQKSITNPSAVIK